LTFLGGPESLRVIGRCAACAPSLSEEERDMRRFARPCALVLVALCALVAAACGDDDEDGTTSAAGDATTVAADSAAASSAPEPSSTEEPAATTDAATTAGETTEAPAESAPAGEAAALPGECGKLPFAPPKDDPDGVLEALGLPDNLKAGYNSYSTPLHKTPYETFAPKSGPPWTVGYSDSFSGNAWRASALAATQANFAAAKEQGLVEGELIVTDSNGANDVQIQQMRQMIQQGVDLIFAIPASPTAMNGVIEEAFKAGIPVLTLSAPVTSEYALNVDVNPYIGGVRMAQGLAMLLEGKGSIMAVEGIAGTPGSQQIEAGGKDVFSKCPDIEIVADFAGDWNNATAKTAMLQALATNPGELDGVWTQGSMEKGVIEALEQVGREVPTVTMGNPDQAGLAYWRDHAADGYQGVATASPSAAAADAMFRIGMRVMEGKKPRISSIAGAPPLIVDAANVAKAQATFPDAAVEPLDAWVKDDWTFDSAGVANPASGPNGTWLNDETLDVFFTEPGSSYQGIDDAGQDG
jgi:ribose transport system substrate-binding protein